MGIIGITFLWLLLAAFVIVLIRKAMQYHNQKILDTQAQYFDLFESNPTPMAIVDRVTLQFIAVNKASIKCYGYSAAEFMAMKTPDIGAPGAITEKLSIETANFGLKDKGLARQQKKNGEIILAEISSSEIVFKNRNCKLLLARDLTEIIKAKEEKKLAEEEAIKQRDFTAYVLENFPVDVAVFDKDHKYILINKVAVKNDEMRKWMIGKDDFDYFRHKGMDLAIAEKRREGFNKAMEGDSVEWIDEHTINGEQKYILRKFYPYKQDGKLKYVYGYGMDITEVKKAQMQKDEYIRQLEKIAFTTSHKIRQPICNIQGLISLLNNDEFDKKELKHVIDCMQTSVLILDDFTKELAIKLHEYQQRLKPTM